MTNLTERQVTILEGVCQEYIKQAWPVSSQFLKERKHLPFSSATIRTEFNQLETHKYLDHPYISSGRVPTDKGYRFLVDKILEKDISRFLKEGIFEEIFEEFFEELKELKDFLKISQQLAKSLSRFSSNLVLTYLPQEDIFWKEGWGKVIKEPEFQNIHFFKEFIRTVNDFEKDIDKFDWPEQKIKVYIGKENPFKEKNLSVVLTKTLFRNKEGKIAILGPKRMDFKKNIGLINYLLKSLENL